MTEATGKMMEFMRNDLYELTVNSCTDQYASPQEHKDSELNMNSRKDGWDIATAGMEYKLAGMFTYHGTVHAVEGDGNHQQIVLKTKGKRGWAGNWGQTKYYPAEFIVVRRATATEPPTNPNAVPVIILSQFPVRSVQS